MRIHLLTDAQPIRYNVHIWKYEQLDACGGVAEVVY